MATIRASQITGTTSDFKMGVINISIYYTFLGFHDVINSNMFCNLVSGVGDKLRFHAS